MTNEKLNPDEVLIVRRLLEGESAKQIESRERAKRFAGLKISVVSVNAIRDKAVKSGEWDKIARKITKEALDKKANNPALKGSL